ncbi:MAG: hypothetical protein ACRC1Z_19465 [Waterburya sp.]
MDATLLYLSIIVGTAAWAVLIWMNWDRLQPGGHKRIISFLASIHVFRYVGLVALVPIHFDPEPFGFTHTYLQQVAYGDTIAAVLAILTIIAVRQDWKLASTLTWAFFLEGTIDTLNAGPNFVLHITNQNLVGAMGWLILTIYVPVLIVSETVLGFYLVRRLLAKSDSQSLET